MHRKQRKAFARQVWTRLAKFGLIDSRGLSPGRSAHFAFRPGRVKTQAHSATPDPSTFFSSFSARAKKIILQASHPPRELEQNAPTYERDLAHPLRKRHSQGPHVLRRHSCPPRCMSPQERDPFFNSQQKPLNPYQRASQKGPENPRYMPFTPSIRLRQKRSAISRCKNAILGDWTFFRPCSIFIFKEIFAFLLVSFITFSTP